MMSRICTAVVAFCLSVAAHAQCTPAWMPGYDFGHLRINSSSFYSTIDAAAVFDDHSGTGPALFIGGDFTVLGEEGGRWMAKRVGETWVAVPGFDGRVRCMAVMDDGSGPALFVGGSFTQSPGGSGCLAKWDGSVWTDLGLARGATSDRGIYAMALHDDGRGTALFVGGAGFAPPGQPNSSLVMRRSGTAWESLDSGGWSGSSVFEYMVAVRTLISFDGGSGPRLYAGGSFNNTPAGPSNCVVAWDGTHWQGAGDGLLSGGVIKVLAIHQGIMFAAGDGGGGPQAIWRWNGAAWDLSYGTSADFPSMMGATALLSFNDGGGPVLYGLVGSDSHSGAELVTYAGGVWQPRGPLFSQDALPGQPFMSTLVAAPIGSITRLVAVGRCTRNGTTMLNNGAAWVEGAWRALESIGAGSPTQSAMVYFDPEVDDGSVYTANRRYTSAGWTPSPLPVANLSAMLRLHQGGTSSLVIRGGSSFRADSGSGWQVLPSLNSACVGIGTDTGTESLVAVSTSPLPYRVQRLVGNAWVDLGSPFSGSSLYLHPNKIISYDSGAGPKLHVGGVLQADSSGRPTSYLAYLDNGQWVHVAGVPGQIVDMCVFDVGNGPELILACDGNVIGGAAGGIYRWNGSRIDSVGTALGTVWAGSLLPFDDGTGRRLWASVDPNPLGSLVYLVGGQWHGLEATNSRATSMAPALRGDRSHSLMLAGAFMMAGSYASSGIAELATCPRTCTADFDGDGDVGTDADIERFLSCIAGACCPACGSEDFNRDGDAGTDADIESFFRVLAGGAC